MSDCLLRKFDDVPVTHALVEKYLPAGEAWCFKGYMFLSPDLGARMGEPDTSVTFGDMAFPAWDLSRPRPVAPF